MNNQVVLHKNVSTYLLNQMFTEYLLCDKIILDNKNVSQLHKVHL